MLTQLTIPKARKRLPAEDYELLRQTGIAHLQKLSGAVWTDYNLHDPGVTILELLCYAITDLGYRTGFPIADLLTNKGAEGPPRDNAFFTPAEILTSHPVTINDYRKLLLDKIPGLRNVWFSTLDDQAFSPAIYFNKNSGQLTNLFTAGACEALQLKGLYSVRFEMEEYALLDKTFLQTLKIYRNKTAGRPTVPVEANEVESVIKNLICAILRSHRNLCEDVAAIAMIQEEKVAICAEIELLPAADAEAVWLQIYRRVYDYISPAISLYSLEEMKAGGKRTEEIFQGPVSERGFIDYDELEAFGQRTVLYTSDILSVIIDIPGVQAVRDIQLSSYKKDASGKFKIYHNAEKYCLHLSDPLNYAFKLALDFNATAKEDQYNHINFYKDYIYFSPKRSAAYQAIAIIARQKVPPDFQPDVPLPMGTHQNTGEYISIQNEFPSAYMLGQGEVPKSATSQRKGQRLQLKGYLLFFEQLLANYQAQLSGVSSLLSWRTDADSQHSYFFTNLRNVLHPTTGRTEISDLEAVLAAYNSSGAEYQEVLESNADFGTCRNRFLDHLLARFNEQFTDYSLFKFSQNPGTGFYNTYTPAEMIAAKTAFLQSYPQLSGNRSKAFTYTQPVAAMGNVSGLQMRISAMLGCNGQQFRRLVKVVEVSAGVPKLTSKGKIQVCDNRQEAFTSTFGLHVLEHILLRPQAAYPDDVLYNLCKPGTDNGDDCLQPDSYSLKLSVVLPGWLAISSDPDWRRFVESRIRQEAPAHVGVKICWLNPVQLYRFENACIAFMNALAVVRTCNAVPSKAALDLYLKALKAMVEVMGGLKNMYPPSALENCNDIAFDSKGSLLTQPVILNRTALAGGADSGFVFVKCRPERIVRPTG